MKFQILLLVVFFLVSGPICVSAQQLQVGCGTPVLQCCPNLVIPKLKSLDVGEESEDLKLRIVGKQSATIEAYFREEYFRHQFLETFDLGCNEDVVAAKKNELGTFAVRFGKNRDQFQVFGFRKNNYAKPQSTPIIVLEEGCPIRLEWITSRILKVYYGPAQQKEYVIRFNDLKSPQTWTGLYQTDAETPYDPDGPDPSLDSPITEN